MEETMHKDGEMEAQRFCTGDRDVGGWVEVGFTPNCQGSHKVTCAAATSECLCAFIGKCKKRVAPNITGADYAEDDVGERDLTEVGRQLTSAREFTVNVPP